jgi:hypothetical protein
VFGDVNAADFAPGSKALAIFGIIDQVIKDLDDAKAGQVSNPHTSKETLIDAVRLDVQNIARTAAVIDYTQPGFAEDFRPPKAYNPAAVLTTADAFLLQLAGKPADDAPTKAAKAALVAQFVAHEMSATFVTALQGDRQAITDKEKEIESDDEDRIEDTASIGPLIQKGMEAVHTLDAIMHNKYGAQPAKMAAWTSASHVERDPQRNDPTPPTPTPQTTPPSK